MITLEETSLFDGLRPQVTVILPVHNPDINLLDRALGSVRAQGCDDLEMLVVDDGSSRNFVDLIDDLVAGDSKIRVLHQENQGVSAARNRGLDAARGVFVAFLDSDDYFAEGFLSAAMHEMLQKSADIVIGNILVASDNAFAVWGLQRGLPGSAILVGVDEFQAWRGRILSCSPSFVHDVDHLVFTSVCGTLYRLEKIRGVRFPVGVRHAEDRLFNVAALNVVDRVVAVNRTWLVYDRSNEGSVTSSFRAEQIPELESTVDAYARIAGLMLDNERVESIEVQAGATLGILNYVKLAALAVAASKSKAGVSSLSRLISTEAVNAALQNSVLFSGVDRLAASAARHRMAGVLVFLAELRTAYRLFYAVLAVIRWK